MTQAVEVNFEGHQPRDCGEHRTLGSHRAWCYDCSQYCYPDAGCNGCEIPALTADRDRARDIAVALEQQNAAALALHFPIGGPTYESRHRCVQCRLVWPCATAVALGVEP